MLLLLLLHSAAVPMLTNAVLVNQILASEQCCSMGIVRWNKLTLTHHKYVFNETWN